MFKWPNTTCLGFFNRKAFSTHGCSTIKQSFPLLEGLELTANCTGVFLKCMNVLVVCFACFLIYIQKKMLSNVNLFIPNFEVADTPARLLLIDTQQYLILMLPVMTTISFWNKVLKYCFSQAASYIFYKTERPVFPKYAVRFSFSLKTDGERYRPRVL